MIVLFIKMISILEVDKVLLSSPLIAKKKVKFYFTFSCAIVIHPKTLIEKYKINDTFKNIFHEQNIFIVDEDHHLLTRWAKHSLSYATFMMMQYANIQYNNNFFDKYVLLTSSCLPLYTLDEIYNELSIYNKSWINGKWVDTQFKFIFSEWAILDKQHAIYFFYNNIFK